MYHELSGFPETCSPSLPEKSICTISASTRDNVELIDANDSKICTGCRSESSPSNKVIPEGISATTRYLSSENNLERIRNTGVSGGGTVRFGRVHTRVFRLTLGCNPSTHEGLPVELSWDVLYSEDYSLGSLDRLSVSTNNNESDQQQDDDRVGRVVLGRHSALKRFQIAKDGHSLEEIRDLFLEMEDIKRSRRCNAAENIDKALVQEEKQFPADRPKLSNSREKQVKTGKNCLARLFLIPKPGRRRTGKVSI